MSDTPSLVLLSDSEVTTLIERCQVEKIHSSEFYPIDMVKLVKIYNALKPISNENPRSKAMTAITTVSKILNERGYSPDNVNQEDVNKKRNTKSHSFAISTVVYINDKYNVAILVDGKCVSSYIYDTKTDELEETTNSPIIHRTVCQVAKSRHTPFEDVVKLVSSEAWALEPLNTREVIINYLHKSFTGKRTYQINE